MKKTVIKPLRSLISMALIIGCLLSGTLSAFAYDKTGYPNTHINTGDYATDLVEVAKTQIGYSEGYTSAGTEGDYTKYNDWYSGEGAEGPWCGVFVSWCADQAGIPRYIIRKSGRVTGVANAAEYNNMADSYYGGTAYDFGTTPQPGDLFFSTTQSGVESATHMGIVSRVDNNYIYTIEGNTHDYVSGVSGKVGLVKERQYVRSTGYQYYPGSKTTSSSCHLLFYVHPHYDEVHTHDYYTYGYDATCTERGYIVYTCSTCGDSYTETPAPLGHSFTSYSYNDDAQICKDGTEIAGCDRGCGATDIRICEGSALQDPNPRNPFIDVPPGEYYYEPVLWAVEDGITMGTSATTFSPGKDCTRAQVVTFLWRAAGQPAPTSNNNPFTDVKANQYYYEAVLWAVEQGITAGTSATTFSPNDPCTRAQVVTFQWRAAGKPAPTATENTFTDVAPGKYYYDAVLWAGEAGITQGTSATQFSPNKTCTRGQIVTFLYRQYS